MNEELKVVISAQMAEFVSAMKDALTALNNIQKALKQTNEEGEKAKKKAKSVGEAFKSAFKEAKNSAKENFAKIGKSISNGLATATKAIGSFAVGAAKAAASGAVALGGAILGVVQGTEEYRNSMAQLTTAFEVAGSSAETAKETYNDLYRVLGDSGQATEAAQHLAKLTNNEQDLAEWTNICQGVFANFGESLPINGLTEAANETAKTGIVTGVLADALNRVAISSEQVTAAFGENKAAMDAYNQAIGEGATQEDAFNAALQACNDEAERERIIRETLNGLYGDAAATYEANNAKILAQREAQAQLQDTLAKVGEVLSPLVTAFTELANGALAYVMPYIEDFANTYGPMIVPVIKNLAETYLPMLKDVLKQVADYVGQAIKWVVDNWGIIAAIAGVITGIAVAIGLYNAVAAVKAAMDAAQVTTLWGLVAAYAAQAAAMIVAIAPYLLIVAGIAAVIAIIVLCVKHWDKIKEKITEVAGKAKEKVLDMKDKIVGWFGDIKDKMSSAISDAKTAVVNKFTEIKTSITNKVREAKEVAVNKFEDLKSGITDKMTSAKTAVTNVVSGIVTSFRTKFTSAKTTIVNIFSGIKDGITNKINDAKDAVSNVIDKIKGFFDFEFKLPHIPKPSFGITPEGWVIGDLLKGSIPKLSIKWNAQGGVFDTPTLFAYGHGSLGGLGENGAEAVVPLEKNLGWLDKLATMLQERMGGNRPIVLTVDGKVFAQTSIDSINQLTRQTGSLGLNLV